MPFATLSMKPYIPYTIAEFLDSFPITSEIKLVAVLSIIAKPMPWNTEKKYTRYFALLWLFKKMRGIDDAATRQSAMSRGFYLPWKAFMSLL